MNTSELAKLLGAKRIGRGKYRGACPACCSANKTTLSVVEGRTATLVHCFSQNCASRDIMAAIGLKPSNLFYAESASPQEIREALRLREEAERKAKHAHKLSMHFADMARQCERMCLELLPDYPQEFHDMLHAAREWNERWNRTRRNGMRSEVELGWGC